MLDHALERGARHGHQRGAAVRDGEELPGVKADFTARVAVDAEHPNVVASFPCDARFHRTVHDARAVLMCQWLTADARRTKVFCCVEKRRKRRRLRVDVVVD